VGGDRYLPTPTGWFSIFAKFSPYTMISPWPRSSYKWYPPSQTGKRSPVLLLGLARDGCRLHFDEPSELTKRCRRRQESARARFQARECVS
jgi:hypothetical protein